MPSRRPPPGRDPHFERRVQHANNIHYFFLGSRGVPLHKQSTSELVKELRRSGLAKKKKGRPYLVMSKWGVFNKMIRNGFGKPWVQLSDIQKARVIQAFVGAHLTEAYFPSPSPAYLRKVPYNDQTRQGLVSFFNYFMGLYGSFRRDAHKRTRDSHPEVRDTAAREFLLYSDLIAAARATKKAIEEGKVRW